MYSESPKVARVLDEHQMVSSSMTQWLHIIHGSIWVGNLGRFAQGKGPETCASETPSMVSGTFDSPVLKAFPEDDRKLYWGFRFCTRIAGSGASTLNRSGRHSTLLTVHKGHGTW